MASRIVTLPLLNRIIRPSRIISPSLLRPHPRIPRTLQPAACRFAHAIPKPPSQTPSGSEPPSSSESKPRKLLEPHYELTFTCVPCGDRSTHTISKQGYHKGSVLITCPSCRNRHIISDHLKIFGDRNITVEDLMREKGQLVKRGTLGESGDVEFWEDGTVTERGEGAALGEEEDATISREARDPSSQSTEPAPSASTPLGGGGARPSIEGTQHAGPVPSTRRQYSTFQELERQIPGVDSQVETSKALPTQETQKPEAHAESRDEATVPRDEPHTNIGQSDASEPVDLVLPSHWRGTLSRIPQSEFKKHVREWNNYWHRAARPPEFKHRVILNSTEVGVQFRPLKAVRDADGSFPPCLYFWPKPPSGPGEQWRLVRGEHPLTGASGITTQSTFSES